MINYFFRKKREGITCLGWKSVMLKTKKIIDKKAEQLQLGFTPNRNVPKWFQFFPLLLLFHCVFREMRFRFFLIGFAEFTNVILRCNFATLPESHVLVVRVSFSYSFLCYFLCALFSTAWKLMSFIIFNKNLLKFFNFYTFFIHLFLFLHLSLYLFMKGKELYN